MSQSDDQVKAYGWLIGLVCLSAVAVVAAIAWVVVVTIKTFS